MMLQFKKINKKQYFNIYTFRVGQKNPNLKNQIKPDLKNSTESKPNFVKYLNGFKFWISKEPKSEHNLNQNILDVRSRFIYS